MHGMTQQNRADTSVRQISLLYHDLRLGVDFDGDFETS